VPTGAVYGVLGPNGAGKTTAIRVLATLLLPTAGSARVFGHDVVEEAEQVRASVSLTGQFASVDEDLTGVENLVLLGRLWGYDRGGARRRAEALLDAFGLADAGGRQVKTFSGGMRRRLDIAASIVVTPRLIFLDEPTTGLDPRSRNQVWEIVRALVAEGTTVLLTTQHLDEADRLADRGLELGRGALGDDPSVVDHRDAVGEGVVHVRTDTRGERDLAAEVLRARYEVILDRDPLTLTVRAEHAGHAADLLSMLHQAGVPVASSSFGQPSLDEVFLELTGRPPASSATVAEDGRVEGDA
jgi:ABC-2 type transport system ATP-binding protein